MQILREDQLPPCEERWIYRETLWSGLVSGLVFLGIAGFLVALPFIEGFASDVWLVGLCLCGTAFFGGFGRLHVRVFFRSLRRDHWLLRWSPEGLALRYRSIYNHRFPADQPTAVLLAREEIAAIGPAVTLLDSLDGEGDWSRLLKRRSLEVKLADGVDVAPLKAALVHEASLRSRKGVRVNHFPLIVTRAGALQLELRHPKRVCAALAGDFPVRGAARRERRFAQLSAAEREEHILDLLLAGDKIGAIKAAREVYGCDLTEAKNLVDELEP